MAFKPKSDPEYLAKTPADTTASGGFRPRSDPERVVVRAHSRGQRRRPEGLLKASGEAIPGTLGTLGGVLAGPAGAGVGGASGAILRNALYAGAGYEVPAAFSSEALADIGTTGALQAGFQRFMPPGGVPAVARGTMRLAAPMTPKVAETMVSEQVGVTPKGLAKVKALMNQLGAQKGAGLRAASREGAFGRRQDIADEAFAEVAEALKAHPERSRLMPLLNRLRLTFLRSGGSKMNPILMERARKVSDKISNPVYDALGKEVVIVEPALALRVQWNKSIADRLRSRLNAIPDVGLANARLETLHPVKETVARAIKYGRLTGLKEQVVAAGIGAGAGYGAGALVAPEQSTVRTRAAMGLAGAFAGALSRSPQAVSSLALAMGNPLLANALINPAVPRAVDWAGRSVLP